MPVLAQEALNRSLPLAARLGALQALAALSAAHGRSLASIAPESLALGVKHTARCAHSPASSCELASFGCERTLNCELTHSCLYILDVQMLQVFIVFGTRIP